MTFLGKMKIVPSFATIDGADFDGSNDYITRGAGLTGAADSKSGILSFWLRKDGGDGSLQLILTAADIIGGAATGMIVQLLNTNKIQVIAQNNNPTTILTIESSTNSLQTSATWKHVLISWNLGIVGARHIYIDDVSDLTETIFTDDTIDYTQPDWSAGAEANGTDLLNGCLADVFFAPGQYLDFSLVANRRKFISETGRPVNLGTDGSVPTGVAPLVFFHLDVGEAVANFATNRGTGGDFTITGTLATASTSP